jgi:hypothetical protein
MANGQRGTIMMATNTFALLVWTLATVPMTQLRPDFSGSWSGGRPAANMVGVVGATEMTITQDAESLTIDRLYGRNRVKILIRLDAKESRNRLDPGAPPGRGASVPRELVSTAVWEGLKLKISTIFSYSDARSGKRRNVTTIETLSMEGGGLVVERSDEAMGPPPGEMPLKPGMMQASRLVYTRVSKLPAR